ncbi:ADP-ribose polymerase [Candidatus Dojkabacteria bacterium]|jgi:poly [ADP-ribose] polymerase|nr:ADP-ribose polymerase [Candidatus Dojkabacteria bacterium]
MTKVVKLIMVTDINNNKYYNMFEQADGTFKVEYGRVDSTVQHASYSMRDWDKKYREKTNKGYKDITHLYEEVDTTSAATVDETFISNDKFVKQLIEDLQRYANNTVKENYKVSTKNVTQKMIDEAQTIIDEIAKVYNSKYTKEDLNKLLLKLFTVIPRKMGHVQDYLVSDGDSKERVAKIIDSEQSILDSLAGQVLIQEPVAKEEKTDKKIGILDSMGISVSHVTDQKIIDKIKRLMGDSSDKFSRLFEVTNFKTEKKYKTVEIKNEELFWHGSRNQNFFNILQTGLLIRPSGAVYTGSMFGDGIYFANKARKSIGYTSLSGSYWANGNANKAYLALFSVNLGNKKDVFRHSSDCYHFSEKNIAPYNSVYAHGGADLRNDEFIIYNGNRCTVKYLVEIK